MSSLAQMYQMKQDYHERRNREGGEAWMGGVALNDEQKRIAVFGTLGVLATALVVMVLSRNGRGAQG